jgi:hypothetical protein
MNIVEFLEARIAEDAERAGSGWSRLGDTRWETDNYGRNFLTPAAVLAECKAKREIIEFVSGWGHEYNDDDTWYSCGLATGHYDDEPGSGCADEAKHGECTCGLMGRQAKILAPLAAVYKDHPDYREEWRHA